MSSAEGLFGGACLGVRGSDCVVFFDWEEGVMVRKIDVVPKEVLLLLLLLLLFVSFQRLIYTGKMDLRMVWAG